MLFNSPEFIFLFLPLAVVLHFTLARFGMNAAIVGTTCSSLLFYAWWNPPYVVLPAVSIVANFLLARRMLAVPRQHAKFLMIAGIIANVLVLSYFKYADFLVSIVDGHKPQAPQVPLALSFTTFVQIAFLVHIYQRRTQIDFNAYALFVAFFPHLIAGPIVRWPALGRQISDPSRYRLDWNNVALGLTIFTLGLAKKILLADSLAPHANLVFDTAAAGEPVTGAAAWGACFAFVLQIYFDFSGYSDMAVGLGLFFNYRLPINFGAPLRSTSVAEFWRRWHVTLSRLARDLIYVPIALGRGPFWRGVGLFITMVVIGVWHGAGWPFVAWGAYYGVLLLIDVGWSSWRGPRPKSTLKSFVGWAFTVTAFAVSAAFFRGADIETSGRMLAAMTGFGGAAAPVEFSLDRDNWLITHHYVTREFVLNWFGNTWSVVSTLVTLAMLAVAVLVPDTMEITNYREGEPQANWRRNLTVLAWRPSPLYLAAGVVVFALVFARIGRVSEFLYYQF
jgi:D-alanyl-lipoteichoic acid acyltransferase DltB (MBOAT superfamily)